jgi:hypothetical protein
MASPAAQAFFDKQSPQDRMAIIDSWGGQDLTDEWFANAQAAGSVPAAGAPAPAAGAAPTIEQLQAQTVNQSEDFKRFAAGDAERWGPYYDAAASQAAGRPQFRSSRGAPGMFDKPTECPAGQTPGGPDETSPCKSTDALMATQDAHNQQKYGGQQPAAAAQGAGAAPAYFGQDDPLQRMLTNQMASGGGSFAGTASGGQFAGGGVFSQGAGQYGQPATTGTGTANPAATAALGALAPAAPAPAAPAPAPVAAPVAAPFAAPEPATYSDPYEAWKQGGRTGPAPGRSAPASPGGPPAPAEPRADPFEMVPGSGSFEDLIDPRRRKQDARLGGNWF